MSVKRAIMLTAAVLIAVPVVAPGEPVSFGIKGGINMANLTDDSEPTQDNLVGIAVGGVLSLELSPAACLDGEVLYIQKGASPNETLDGCGSADKDFKLGYVSISPMVRFKIHTGSFTPYLLGGTEFDLLLSAKRSGTFGCSGQGGDYDYDEKDELKSTDLGITLGGGVEFPMGGPALFVEGRCAMGLTDINKETPVVMDAPADGSTKTNGIYLFGGLRF
jgi:hypothetical protein